MPPAGARRACASGVRRGAQDTRGFAACEAAPRRRGDPAAASRRQAGQQRAARRVRVARRPGQGFGLGSANAPVTRTSVSLPDRSVMCLQRVGMAHARQPPSGARSGAEPPIPPPAGTLRPQAERRSAAGTEPLPLARGQAARHHPRPAWACAALGGAVPASQTGPARQLLRRLVRRARGAHGACTHTKVSLKDARMRATPNTCSPSRAPGPRVVFSTGADSFFGA